VKKRRLIVGALAALLVALAAVVCCCAVRRSRAPAPRPAAAPKTFACVRIVTVYAVLAEKPEAKTVRLVGDAAAEYRAYFERAGLTCAADEKEASDIVFIAGATVSAAGRAVDRTLQRGGIVALSIDARRLAAPRFWETLTAFPGSSFRFWVPGAEDWLVVGRRDAGRVKLAAIMDLFARETAFADLSTAECDSLPTLLASFVGAKDDVMPAFNGSVAVVRAEDFVTRQVPSFDWIDTTGIDGEIASAALAHVRTAQIVRRLVLTGNLYAARGDETRAAETWARAARRHPGDTLLVERLERLAVNGKVFLQLGKAAMAARCYETMAQICPDDPKPVYNYGICLEKLGKKDVAARAFDRARALEKKAGKGTTRAK
jgi:tetratricopeptide (TPR) repeat protein